MFRAVEDRLEARPAPISQWEPASERAKGAIEHAMTALIKRLGVRTV